MPFFVAYLSFVDHFPDYEQQRDNEVHGIRKEERGGVPFPWQEYGITADKCHDQRSAKCIISAKRLPKGLVRQRITTDSLSLQRL